MQIKNLVKKYDDKVVVDDISFDLLQGKVTSLIGPNGAGKTTVLNMLTRLLKPDAGEILLDGRDIHSFGNNELAKRISILSQQNNIQSKLTIEELVSFGRFPHSHGRLNEKDAEYIYNAMDFMELTEIKDQYLDEISGGQRQRALIAMTLAQDTDIIFLDEPTNNLDIYHSTRLMQTIRRLCDDLGKTIVMVLHELNYASFYSDYICAFNHGKIAAYGGVDEIMNNEFLKSIYRVDFQIIHIHDKPLSIYY